MPSNVWFCKPLFSSQTSPTLRQGAINLLEVLMEIGYLNGSPGGKQNFNRIFSPNIRPHWENLASLITAMKGKTLASLENINKIIALAEVPISEKIKNYLLARVEHPVARPLSNVQEIRQAQFEFIFKHASTYPREIHTYLEVAHFTAKEISAVEFKEYASLTKAELILKNLGNITITPAGRNFIVNFPHEAKNVVKGWKELHRRGILNDKTEQCIKRYLILDTIHRPFLDTIQRPFYDVEQQIELYANLLEKGIMDDSMHAILAANPRESKEIADNLITLQENQIIATIGNNTFSEFLISRKYKPDFSNLLKVSLNLAQEGVRDMAVYKLAADYIEVIVNNSYNPSKTPNRISNLLNGNKFEVLQTIVKDSTITYAWWKRILNQPNEAKQIYAIFKQLPFKYIPFLESYMPKDFNEKELTDNSREQQAKAHTQLLENKIVEHTRHYCLADNPEQSSQIAEAFIALEQFETTKSTNLQFNQFLLEHIKPQTTYTHKFFRNHNEETNFSKLLPELVEWTKANSFSYKLLTPNFLEEGRTVLTYLNRFGLLAKLTAVEQLNITHLAKVLSELEQHGLMEQLRLVVNESNSVHCGAIGEGLWVLSESTECKDRTDISRSLLDKTEVEQILEKPAVANAIARIIVTLRGTSYSYQAAQEAIKFGQSGETEKVNDFKKTASAFEGLICHHLLDNTYPKDEKTYSKQELIIKNNLQCALKAPHWVINTCRTMNLLDKIKLPISKQKHFNQLWILESKGQGENLFTLLNWFLQYGRKHPLTEKLLDLAYKNAEHLGELQNLLDRHVSNGKSVSQLEVLFRNADLAAEINQKFIEMTQSFWQSFFDPNQREAPAAQPDPYPELYMAIGRVLFASERTEPVADDKNTDDEQMAVVSCFGKGQ